jgi:hypothetical protein
MTRSSQKRKLTARIAVNCTPDQKATIVARADNAGLSPSAICLAMMLDAPLPKGRRRRQPTPQEKALTAYLAVAQNLTDALKASLAELGKSGSNLNQIAYMLNANTAPARILNIIESALEEYRALVKRHDEIFSDLDEIRTIANEVWPFER